MKLGPSRKEDKELVEAILGGEMRNAWQPTAPGEGKDTRRERGGGWNKRTPAFLTNYDRIFRSKS